MNWFVVTVYVIVLYVGNPLVCSQVLCHHLYISNFHDAHIAPSYLVNRIKDFYYRLFTTFGLQICPIVNVCLQWSDLYVPCP